MKYIHTIQSLFFLVVSFWSVDQAASQGCAGWCGAYTCSSPQCYGCSNWCDGKGGPKERCMPFCTADTCSSPECYDCSVCGGTATPVTTTTNTPVVVNPVTPVTPVNPITPGQSGCATWCSVTTCESPLCFGCNVCADTRNGCAFWCSADTTASPQCRGCTNNSASGTPSANGGSGGRCAFWCNQWNFRSPQCFGCGAFPMSAEDSDPADRPAYCDHVPEEAAQYMLECNIGSGALCSFLDEGTKACLEICGGSIDSSPDCAVPQYSPETWCANMPQVAIPYIDQCKNVDIAPLPVESDADLNASDPAEPATMPEEAAPEEEAAPAPSPDSTSASALISASGIALATAVGAVGMLSLSF